MVKNQFVRNTMIIFLCLFSFMQCQVTWIDYDFSTMTVERKMTDPGKTHSYALDCKGGQLPYYVKVEVTSDDTNPAPLVCFSNKQQTCTEREQLVKNAVGKTAVMWLKREQFEKYNKALLGREVNSLNIYKKLIQPNVIKKIGQIINPMTANDSTKGMKLQEIIEKASRKKKFTKAKF